MKTIQCIIIRADAWCHYIMSLEISCLIPKFPIGVNLSYYWYFMISGWIRQVLRKNTYLVHVCFGSGGNSLFPVGGGGKASSDFRQNSQISDIPPFALEKTVFSPLLGQNFRKFVNFPWRWGGGGRPPPAPPRFPPMCFGVDWKQSIMHINFGLWKHHSPTGAGLIESSANNKFTNQNWYFSPCMQNSRNLSIMYISNKQLHTVTAV
jgi:hypothetical protein